MHRRPWFTILASVLAVALPGAAACKKDKEESSAGGEKEPGAAGAEQGERREAPSTGERARMPATGFAVFPADSDFVASLSFESLRESALWEKYRDQILEETGAGFADFEKACGVGPMEAFDSLLAGGKAESQDEIVVVLSGMKREEIESCAEKLATEGGGGIEITQEGKLTRFKSDRAELWAAWLDEQTLVASMNSDKGFLEARASGKDGLDGNEAFMDLLGQVDGAATFWFAAMPGTGSDVAQGFRQVGGKAEALFASLKLDAGLYLDGGLRMASPEDADKTAAMARQMLGTAAVQAKSLAKFVNKVKIRTQERDVIVQVKLSEEELKELSQALEQFYRGMGGMMGGM